jgi:hypothetical protein
MRNSLLLFIVVILYLSRKHMLQKAKPLQNRIERPVACNGLRMMTSNEECTRPLSYDKGLLGACNSQFQFCFSGLQPSARIALDRCSSNA